MRCSTLPPGDASPALLLLWWSGCARARERFRVYVRYVEVMIRITMGVRLLRVLSRRFICLHEGDGAALTTQGRSWGAAATRLTAALRPRRCRGTAESPRGLLAALSPAGRTRLDGPCRAGAPWQILQQGLNVKRYPVCYATHRIIDAALSLRPRGRSASRSCVPSSWPAPRWRWMGPPRRTGGMLPWPRQKRSCASLLLPLPLGEGRGEGTRGSYTHQASSSAASPHPYPLPEGEGVKPTCHHPSASPAASANTRSTLPCLPR
jgi:hypothetical protein